MTPRMRTLSIVAAFFVLAGCEGQGPIAPDVAEQEKVQLGNSQAGEFEVDHLPGGVTVMTWNIYVGADVDVVLSAAAEEVPFKVAEPFQMVQQTNFPERAEAIARQIRRSRPHLVGLQEVSLIRRQSPGDFLIGNPNPAEEVVYDYLEILMAALKAQGLHYKVAGRVQNADVELPMLVDPQPPAFDDVRLTDFDVVLARDDVQVSEVTEANYQARLIIPFGADPQNPDFVIEIPRGFVAVTARVGRKTYRFANTHLEPAGIPQLLPIQLGQAQELAAALQEATDPVILLGDFNSRATSGETYQFLVSEGYVDVWTRNLLPGQGPGYTNPHDADLRNDEIKLNQRIDLIFVRNKLRFRDRQVIGPVFAYVVGDEFRDRTSSGLWPSDHAGVVARLRIPRLGRLA